MDLMGRRNEGNASHYFLLLTLDESYFLIRLRAVMFEANAFFFSPKIISNFLNSYDSYQEE